MRVTSPKEFDLAQLNGVEIVLIGFQGGVPFVGAQQFTISLDAAGEIHVTPSKPKLCPGADCPKGVYVVHLGAADAIEKYLSVPQTESFRAEDLARKLVQLEIDDPATRVTGGPIDVLTITAKGREWINHKTGCPILMTPPTPSERNKHPN
jgi:hypothetical protein